MESYEVTPPGILVTSIHHIKELGKTSVYPVYTAPHVQEDLPKCMTNSTPKTNFLCQCSVKREVIT